MPGYPSSSWQHLDAAGKVPTCLISGGATYIYIHSAIAEPVSWGNTRRWLARRGGAEAWHSATSAARNDRARAF
ncbi:hypothetical protein L209DRAFT_71109 [Thermothelomyces heterothallicus CBS 203.75]